VDTVVAEVERKYDVAGGTAVLDAMETMTGTAGVAAVSLQGEQLLGAVQKAYSDEDLNALRAMTTPEMASYFTSDLAENARRGLINKLSNVAFLQGDPILTQSRQVAAFEEEWSAWLGCAHSVFVNSGASANLLTMAALAQCPAHHPAPAMATV